ncbi:hypothetical protein QBC45DRAFT_405584, partial [Copromyces sp. CBS 386.78]
MSLPFMQHANRGALAWLMLCPWLRCETETRLRNSGINKAPDKGGQSRILDKTPSAIIGHGAALRTWEGVKTASKMSKKLEGSAS